MITQQEYKLLKNIIISEYPVLKAYDALHSEEWEGWKPKDFYDIYNSVGELFRSLESDYNAYLNLEGRCSSGGHLVGFVDGFLVISWNFESLGLNSFVEKKPITIDKVRNNSYIYTEIDCMEFLRMYKIYKLWKKKDKEITTTTQITNLAQE